MKAGMKPDFDPINMALDKENKAPNLDKDRFFKEGDEEKLLP